ncbi:MAG: hypothetical protein GF408_07600 [Candidatus Omnitrophica bacterium]|nr:hypothetical protein [Candidatus Omnitrophota bacterium]
MQMPHLFKRPDPSGSLKGYAAVPAMDIGATHLRIAFVLRHVRTGEFCGDARKTVLWEMKIPVEEVRELQAGPVESMLAFICGSVRSGGMRAAEQAGVPVVKHAGVGALGGYYSDGSMHPGTCPKRKDLEGVNLAGEIAKGLGEGWRVTVNNDGMVQALITSEMLLNSPVRQRIPEEALSAGKIMVIAPGTSIGGGGVFIEKNGFKVRPMPGPHQIWDIPIRKIGKGEEFLARTEDDDHPSLKKARREGSFLSLDIGGTYMDARARELGFPNAKEMGDALSGNMEQAMRHKAEGLYRRTGRDLALTIEKMYLGKAEKAVVNGPKEAGEFRESTKGTRIYVLGGWLTANDIVKGTVMKAVLEELKNKGIEGICVIPQDEVPGLESASPRAGVLGASLLVPEKELRAKEQDPYGRRTPDAEISLGVIKEILKNDDTSIKAADEVEKALAAIAQNSPAGPDGIPSLFSMAGKEFSPEETARLSRVAFRIFTGMSEAEYSVRSPGQRQEGAPREIERARVLTLTVNPGLDLEADCMVRFGAKSASSGKGYRLDPGGKGFNVSVGLAEWGVDSVPLGFLGGPSGDMIKGLLAEKGIRTEFITGIKGATRINPTVHSGGRGLVHLENPGPGISVGEKQRLEESLDLFLGKADILLLAGTLPDGLDKDFYAVWITEAGRRGCRVYIDTRDPEVLERAVGAGPHYLGINIREFADYLGEDAEEIVSSEEKIADGGLSLVEKGIERVVISRGAKGIIMCAGGGAWRAFPPKIEEVCPVGAGDTVNTAFIYGDLKDMPALETLKLAAAASAVTATRAGTGLAGLEESLGKMSQVDLSRIR